MMNNYKWNKIIYNFVKTFGVIIQISGDRSIIESKEIAILINGQKFRRSIQTTTGFIDLVYWLRSWRNDGMNQWINEWEDE